MLRFYILLVAGVFLLVSFAFLDGWPFRGPSGTEPLSKSASKHEGPAKPEQDEPDEPQENPKPASATTVPTGEDDETRIRKTREDIKKALGDGNEVWRRTLSSTVLDQSLPWGFRSELLDDLKAANQAAMFGPNAAYAHEVVKVAGGDNLTKIALRARKVRGGNVTPELIRRVNGLATDMIRRGQSLRVPTGTLEIRVHKRDFRLFVLLDGDVFVEYPIGLGKNDSTPVGSFTIAGKTKNPPWRMPDGRIVRYGDPEHTIGSRWMGFATPVTTTSYGIHGTVDADSIGKSESEGCIRLLRDDVEELFDLAPEGCSVTVLR